MAKKEAEARLGVTTRAIEKQYGHVVKWLSEAATVKPETISTGCLGLDNAVGNGGFERGLVSEFFGETGAGKSFLGYSVMKQACKVNLNCAIIDVEDSVDPRLLVNIGLPEDKVMVVQGAPTGEANLSIADNLMSTGEFGVIMVDSVAALVPEARVESDYDQASMGLHARLMSAGLQKIIPVAKKTNTLLIFINQIRNKIGSYGNPRTTTGGEALPFYASYRVEVIGSPQTKSRRLIDPGTGELYGHRTSFRIVKNKRNAPFREAEVDLIYGLGYDTRGEVIDLAVDLGVIEKNHTWLNYKDHSWQGKDRVKLDFMENPSLEQELTERVRSIISGHPFVEDVEIKQEVVEENAEPVSKKRKRDSN